MSAGVVGIVLAAGGGTRMGTPKALVSDADGAWLPRAVRLLAGAGCDPVIAVLGAEAPSARALLADLPAVEVVVAEDWQSGMSASVAAAIRAAQGTAARAALITLVDLPALRPAAVARVVEVVGAGTGSLGRATYDGIPGHPVLLGRDHWAELLPLLAADTGARDYLVAAGAVLVECGDLGGGDDVDSKLLD